jgi:hypothetical protein
MAFAGLKKQINKANQVRNSFYIIETVICEESRDRRRPHTFSLQCGLTFFTTSGSGALKN